MLSIKLALFALLTLLEFSSAFYAYVPGYRRDLHEDFLGRSKSEVESHKSDFVLKLVQKLPSAEIPRDVQIRELTNRLIRKYNPRKGLEATSVEKREPTLVKNGDTLSPIQSAAVPVQKNSAGIMQTGTDFSYFTQVKLGSNNDTLLMLLDTGAGTSWVMGPDCSSSACETRASFGTANSSTYKAVDIDLYIAYGSGHVTGRYATDTINFAGMSFPFTLGIANRTSDEFKSFPFSGIIGLSQQTGPVPTFLQTVIRSKSLKANVFGMDLNRASDGTNTGEINFGAPDTSRYSGDLTYTRVAENGPHHWALPLDKVRFGDTQVGVTGRLGYLDSGTSYIFGQPTDVVAFHALVPNAKTTDNNTWTVPCSTTTSMSFTFSGVTYDVPSKDWVGPPVKGVCTSNIYAASVVDNNSWLIGDTFFKNVYALFDVDHDRIGLAKKKVAKSSQTSTSSSGSATQTSTTTNPLLPGASNTASTHSSGTAVSDSAPASATSNHTSIATSTHTSSGNQIRSCFSPLSLLVIFATAILY